MSSAAAADHEADIASLEHEISQLNTQKVDLMKEIEKTKKKKPLLANMTQLQSLRDRQRDRQTQVAHSSPSRPLTKRQKKFQEEYVIPEPARHEHFDSSISKFFTPPITPTDSQPQIFAKSLESLKQEKLDNILLENIYRMFGITAFPVSDPSKGIKRELLGIRIEIFNETESNFEKPHYLILERDVKTSKWNIFKHTIPVFLKVEQLSREYDGLSDDRLYQFCTRIRNDLNKLSYKHQIIEKIRNQSGENIKNMEKDLSLSVLKFKLRIHDIETLIILNLSLDTIESCFIESGFTDSEKLRISNVLQGDIRTFDKRIRDVITSLESS